MFSEQILRHLGHVPPRQVCVDAVHQRRVVPHLGRKRLEKVADFLLMLDVYIEVTHHHDATVGADGLLPPAELACLHVPLHNVHAVLLVERDPRHLIETDDVILTNQASFATGVVDEHLCHRRLPTGNEVRVRRDLLVQMALACPPRAQLDHVVVPFDERHHP